MNTQIPPNLNTPHTPTCDKCQSPMLPTTVFRLSGPLVFIGFTLLIPSLLALGFLVLITIGGLGYTTDRAAQTPVVIMSNAVVSLQSIQGVPPAFIESFRAGPSLAMSQTNQLPPEVLPYVARVYSDFNRGLAAGALSTGAVTAVGAGLTLLGYVVVLPLLIVGFLLVMRKKILKCSGCGASCSR